jgi:hypothetical protein
MKRGRSSQWSIRMVSINFDLYLYRGFRSTNLFQGSRGPAVLDDFTASYGYKFSDAAGYQWSVTT